MQQRDGRRARDEPVPLGGARIALVDLPIGEPIEGHRRRPREDHREDDERDRSRQRGSPCAATNIAPSANGSAKTVCENRMNRRTRAITGESPKIMSS